MSSSGSMLHHISIVDVAGSAGPDASSRWLGAGAAVAAAAAAGPAGPRPTPALAIACVASRSMSPRNSARSEAAERFDSSALVSRRPKSAVPSAHSASTTESESSPSACCCTDSTTPSATVAASSPVRPSIAWNVRTGSAASWFHSGSRSGAAAAAAARESIFAQ